MASQKIDRTYRVAWLSRRMAEDNSRN